MPRTTFIYGKRHICALSKTYSAFKIDNKYCLNHENVDTEEGCKTQTGRWFGPLTGANFIDWTSVTFN